MPFAKEVWAEIIQLKRADFETVGYLQIESSSERGAEASIGIRELLSENDGAFMKADAPDEGVRERREVLSTV